MTFEKEYYQNIWGTVHRHDYCHDLSNFLISKYGPMRILDIGTGCGYLVKLLREKGCEAWGIDISTHACEESCAKPYVFYGDIRNIPFKDQFFDVVHSQGVFEYIPEEDISNAVKEIHRVGRIQHHTIDSGGIDVENFKTVKPHEWWTEKTKQPKVLVACPNHEVKEYAFQRWIERVKSLTYGNYDILVVDNSPTDQFMNRYKNQIPIIQINTKGMEDLSVKRINYSMEVIRETFLKGDYERYLNLESDIIPDKDVVEKMMFWGRNADWISHAYPDRNGDEHIETTQGIGCSLFSRRLMETYGFKDLDNTYMADGGLWMKVRPDGRFKTVELWGIIKINHLKN